MLSKLIRGGLLFAAAALVPACGGGGGGGGGGVATPPSVTVQTPAGIQGGNIVLAYQLTDGQSHACTIAVAWSIDGGTTFHDGTPGPGGDGASGLSSSPGAGTPHAFVWNSVADGVGLSALTPTLIRIIPSDSAAGSGATTSTFQVVNRPFSPPTATVTTPVGSSSGAIPISYRLIDAESDLCSVVATFSLDGGATFSPATAGAGGDGVSGLTSSTGGGAAHTFVWNSAADGVATGLTPASVRFRIAPSDADAGTAGTTGAFTVSNRPFTAPSASVTTPSGVQSGAVSIGYTLADAESDACVIVAEFSFDGGATFSLANAGPGGDGTTGLGSSPGGAAHTFVWNSAADGVALGLATVGVRFRITPWDGVQGTAGLSGAFDVNNRPFTPPVASILTPGGVSSGIIATTFTLADAESDPCSVVLQFSLDGGTTWAAATPGPGAGPLVGLATSSGGTSYGFVWNSFADGAGSAGQNNAVRLRVLPNDGAAGTPGVTATFSVDNSGLASGGPVAGFPVTINPTTRLDMARSIATDGASIYVLGFDNLDLQEAPLSDLSWRVEKRDARTGAAVTAFGSSGALIFNPGPGFDLPVKVLVDGASIFVVGLRETAAGSGVFQVEARKFDAASGAAGLVIAGPAAAAGDGIPLVWTAAVDGSALYLAGPEALSPTESRWRVEKRDKATGASLPGFSATTASSGAIDGCFAMALDATSMWLVGVEQADGGLSSNSRIRIEKRLLSTGAPVAGFGSGGAVTIDAGSGDDLAEDCVRDAGALYVYSRVETGFATGVFSPRLDRLDPATGATLASLSGTGAVDSTGELPARHLAIDGGSLYVASVDNAADRRWRIEKRSASDFSLVPSFGVAGVRTINPSGGDDRPLDVLFLGGVLYVVGSDASVDEGCWRIEGLWK